jgi:hypothetical protein
MATTTQVETVEKLLLRLQQRKAQPLPKEGAKKRSLREINLEGEIQKQAETFQSLTAANERNTEAILKYLNVILKDKGANPVNVGEYMDTYKNQKENLGSFISLYMANSINDPDKKFSLTEPATKSRTHKEALLFNKMSDALANYFIGHLRREQILYQKSRESYARWVNTSGRRPLPHQPHANLKFIMRLTFNTIEADALVSQEWAEEAEAKYGGVTSLDEENVEDTDTDPMDTSAVFINGKDGEGKGKRRRQTKKKQPNPNQAIPTDVESMDELDQRTYANRDIWIRYLRELTENLTPLKKFESDWPLVKTEILACLDKFSKGEVTSSDLHAYTGIPKEHFAGVPDTAGTNEDESVLFFSNLFFGAKGKEKEAAQEKTKTSETSDSPPVLGFGMTTVKNILALLITFGIGVTTLWITKAVSDKMLLDIFTEHLQPLREQIERIGGLQKSINALVGEAGMTSKEALQMLTALMSRVKSSQEVIKPIHTMIADMDAVIASGGDSALKTEVYDKYMEIIPSEGGSVVTRLEKILMDVRKIHFNIYLEEHLKLGTAREAITKKFQEDFATYYQVPNTAKEIDILKSLKESGQLSSKVYNEQLGLIHNKIYDKFVKWKSAWMVGGKIFGSLLSLEDLDKIERLVRITHAHIATLQTQTLEANASLEELHRQITTDTPEQIKPLLENINASEYLVRHAATKILGMSGGTVNSSTAALARGFIDVLIGSKLRDLDSAMSLFGVFWNLGSVMNVTGGALSLGLFTFSAYYSMSTGMASGVLNCLMSAMAIGTGVAKAISFLTWPIAKMRDYIKTGVKDSVNEIQNALPTQIQVRQEKITQKRLDTENLSEALLAFKLIEHIQNWIDTTHPNQKANLNSYEGLVEEYFRVKVAAGLYTQDKVNKILSGLKVVSNRPLYEFLYRRTVSDDIERLKAQLSDTSTEIDKLMREIEDITKMKEVAAEAANLADAAVNEKLPPQSTWQWRDFIYGVAEAVNGGSGMAFQVMRYGSWILPTVFTASSYLTKTLTGDSIAALSSMLWNGLGILVVSAVAAAIRLIVDWLLDIEPELEPHKEPIQANTVVKYFSLAKYNLQRLVGMRATMFIYRTVVQFPILLFAGSFVMGTVTGEHSLFNQFNASVSEFYRAQNHFLNLSLSSTTPLVPLFNKYIPQTFNTLGMNVKFAIPHTYTFKSSTETIGKSLQETLTPFYQQFNTLENDLTTTLNNFSSAESRSAWNLVISTTSRMQGLFTFQRVS